MLADFLSVPFPKCTHIHVSAAPVAKIRHHRHGVRQLPPPPTTICYQKGARVPHGDFFVEQVYQI